MLLPIMTSASNRVDDTPQAPEDKNGSAQPLHSARRRHRWACLVGGVLIGLIFYGLVTAGTFNPLRHTDDKPAGFADAQVEAWFGGRWDVPHEELAHETFVIDDKHYMYFGPGPALLRVPFLAVSDWFDQRLGVLSMTGALAVLLTGTAALSWRVRLLMRGDDAPYRGADSIAGFTLMVLVGGGSTVMCLAAWPWAYQEAIMWGVAGTVWAFVFLIDHLRAPSLRTLALASLAATFAFSSRGSGGVASVVVLAALAGVAVLQAASDHVAWQPARRVIELPGHLLRIPRLPILSTLAAALAPAVAYSSVNYIKFGSLFRLPLERQLDLIAFRAPVLEANGGTLFRLDFVPTNVFHYLRPDTIELRRVFPFVFPTEGAPTILNGAHFEGFQPAASLTATTPLLVTFAAVGIYLIIRGRVRPGVLGAGALRVLLLGAVVSSVVALSIAWNTQRYQGDFLPLLLLGGLVALHALLGRLRPATTARGRFAGAAALGGLALVVLWSVWANFAMGVLEQRYYYVPPETRAGFVAFQQDLDNRLFGPLPPPGIRQGPELPTDPALSDLFIIGECEGLYAGNVVYNETEAWQMWSPVERTNQTGEFSLTIDFPAETSPAVEPIVETRPEGDLLVLPAGISPTAEPILVSGPEGDRIVLAVDYPDDDHARFAVGVESTGQWFPGEEFAIDPDGGQRFDLVFDRHLLEVEVIAEDGQKLLSQLFWKPHPDPTISIGQDGVPSLTTPSFSGEIENHPLVETPLCDRLLDRLQDG